MKKINTGVIFGILFLLLGIVLCIQALGVNINIDYSLIFWSLFALAGLVIIINDNQLSIIPSLMIVVGVWNALNDAGIINQSIFTLIVPIIFIVIGINLIFTKKFFANTRSKAVENAGEILNYNAIFSGVEEKIDSKNFKGLNANAVFGGVELDLRDVGFTEKEVVVYASAVFGGVTFIMPDRYNVVLGESVGIFGGNENKCKKEFDESKNTIYVNCRAVFGGVEIK